MTETESGFIKTATHNYVSRAASVHGARNVEMKGKSVVLPHVHIRGDLGRVRIGRYCRIAVGTVLRPPYAQTEPGPDGAVRFIPLVVGSNSRIGSRCVIEAAAVGSSVFIGDGCVLSKRVIVKDCCRIEDGTVLPPDAVIPPFSVVAGCPGRIVGELPESAAVDLVDESVDEYTAFVQGQEMRS